MSKSSDTPKFKVLWNKKVGMEGFSPVHPKEEKFMSVELQIEEWGKILEVLWKYVGKLEYVWYYNYSY